MLRTYRIGAIFYFIWGVLDLPIGYGVYRGGLELEPGVIQGRVLQMGFYLAVAGLIAIAIARWNWVNSRNAYWANLLLTTVVDLGFILFLLVPGYVSLTRGLPAPMIWILGVIFTSIGYLKTHNTRQSKHS